MHDLETLVVVGRQSLVVLVFVGSAAALYDGSSAAVALIVAAAATQFVLVLRAVVVRESSRTHVLDLISEGGAALPIPAVEHMCRQLRRAASAGSKCRSTARLGDWRV